jgi:hypothetical protein
LVISRETGRNTQILGAFPAIPALSARAIKPGHTDSLSREEPRNPGTGHLDPSHDFVSRNNAGNAFRKLPLNDMKIGPAHSASLHPHKNLSGTGRRHGRFFQTKRIRPEGADPSDHHLFHARPPENIEEGSPLQTVLQVPVAGRSFRTRRKIRSRRHHLVSED